MLHIGGKDYTRAEVQALLDTGALAFKDDVSSPVPNATPPHGPFPGNNRQFGIFSSPGTRPAAPKVKKRAPPFWGTTLSS